ncbi:hypothetical protein O3P69_018462 [Scylla paramamosain]|uniref:Uncharacterized protein n=1 Tax=Scylla paramamosain TaxID=85552 RepID=A0AAW0T2C2_SCYPA
MPPRPQGHNKSPSRPHANHRPTATHLRQEPRERVSNKGAAALSEACSVYSKHIRKPQEKQQMDGPSRPERKMYWKGLLFVIAFVPNYEKKTGSRVYIGDIIISYRAMKSTPPPRCLKWSETALPYLPLPAPRYRQGVCRRGAASPVVSDTGELLRQRNDSNLQPEE